MAESRQPLGTVVPLADVLHFIDLIAIDGRGLRHEYVPSRTGTMVAIPNFHASAVEANEQIASLQQQAQVVGGGHLAEVVVALREALGNEYMDETARRRLSALVDKVSAMATPDWRAPA